VDMIFATQIISATLSKCWKTLKLLLPNCNSNIISGQDLKLGYGENIKDYNNLIIMNG